MPRWECEKCGHLHSSNPDSCDECDHTILIQYRPPSTEGSFKDLAADEGEETFSYEEDIHWLWYIPGVFILFWKFWLVLAVLGLVWYIA